MYSYGVFFQFNIYLVFIYQSIYFRIHMIYDTKKKVRQDFLQKRI